MPLEKVEAPLPGKVLRVSVKVGDAIDESGEICTIEAMKMETPILSPVKGVVKELPVIAGKAIKSGETIALIEY
jgi:biotin carboxyl carrier protein